MTEENKNMDKTIASKNKKSFTKKFFWLLIAIIIFLILAFAFMADKYQAQVLVIAGEKKVGVNPTTERLDFGDLSGDTAATRYINLTAKGTNTYIWVWKFGSIAELIKINDSGFLLNKGDEKRLEFNLYMPISAPVGEKFTGRIWIFKLPKFW